MRILADTSVWVQHFRRGLPAFVRHLQANEILMHAVVLGELATGNLSRRTETLSWLRRLPMANHPTAEECLQFLEAQRLWGRGIGWNDLQVLAASHLSHVPLWSFDSSLNKVATSLGICHTAI